MFSEKWLSSAVLCIGLLCTFNQRTRKIEIKTPTIRAALWQPVAKVWDSRPFIFQYFPLNPVKCTGWYKFDKASDNKKQRKTHSKCIHFHEMFVNGPACNSESSTNSVWKHSSVLPVGKSSLPETVVDRVRNCTKSNY